MLGDDGIKRHIPRIGLDVGEMLAVVRKPDQERAMRSALTRSEGGEAAVIKAESHADALAAVVECNQGHKNQVKR